ncbi:hypothetical protein Poli38472_007960 [Pythium oligandrum]|uniref:AAA+ ATPase domain-containing protein n=1 Tax=Pythium oligandrum TaxID=41045 RepID=A0A8K1CN28_PYTOL|nr:hypothetical protein Poli38472_007960 [Pythium oligandrum]|eukprot:TMW65318.1 hypothetical protein Poli38472_007960 [Pythium oligandrum]
MEAMTDVRAAVDASAVKKRVHVEVCLKAASVAGYEEIRGVVCEYLQHNTSIFTKGTIHFNDVELLVQHVEHMHVTEIDSSDEEDAQNEGVPHWEAHVIVHVFKLSDEPPAEETAEDDDNVSTCQQLALPATMLDGLWESLIYDTTVKRNVLEYATTAMLFSDSKVNPHIISWNRVVLLHGPPGTGKTSLCKALAQKLSIRLADRFPNSYLLEINAHSLFSKWFSESGKLVMKLFRQIQELVEDEEALICVLIDEVESLTAARKAALSGSEPSDAIRVVNALLTQLDALKNHPNVLVLTTSNITEAIDVAFVDRADIKQYIGLPSPHARYEILRSCVEELCRVGLIQGSSQTLLTYRELQRKRASKKRVADQMASNGTFEGDEDLVVSSALLRVAESAEGFSGRSLRKLPFQAHAFFVQARTTTVIDFIQSLSRTVRHEIEQKQQLTSG